MNLGLPQGSVLSPLLFSIFLNDIFKVLQFGQIIAFADDLTIVFSCKNFNELQNIVYSDINRIFKWINANNLVVNLNKSNYMLIGCDSKKKFKNSLTISESDYLKILGINFDKRLSFDSYIKSLSKKISAKTGIVCRIRKILPQKTLLLIYKSLIQSNLIYCCQVWGHTYPSHIKIIKSVQNRVIRVISFSNIRSHISDIYRELKILQINDLISYYSNIYIYKSLNKLNSFASAKFFTFSKTSQRTRSSEREPLALPKCKTNYTQNTIFFKGVQNWNSLNLEIRTQKNFRAFKNKLLDFYYSL